MAHLLTLAPSKTYASVAQAMRAVEKVYGPNQDHAGSADLWWIVCQTDEGRFYPVFIGQRALEAGAHHHFNVIVH